MDDEARAIETAITRISRIGYSKTGRRRVEERSGISLTPPAITVLAGICRLGPARLGVVAEFADLHQSRASREVKRLVDGGYVEQEPDPADLRATLLIATAKGHDAHERYRTAAMEGVQQLIAHWSEDDVRTLAVLLTRLAEEFATITDPQV